MAICAFCGQDETLTDEHVIPEWLIELDAVAEPDPNAPRIRHKGTRTAHGYEWEDQREGPRSLPSVVKVVCGPRCNHGWMNDLENEVKPILTPLVEGHGGVLSAHDQQVLAFWTSKTMMMNEYKRQEARATTEAQRRYLFEHRDTHEPPPNTAVWLGRLRAMNDPPIGTYTHPSALSMIVSPSGQPMQPSGQPYPNTVQTSFALGHAFITILSTTQDAFPTATLQLGSGVDQMQVRRLWPKPRSEIRLADHGGLTEETAERIGLTLANLPNSPGELKRRERGDRV